MTDETNEPLVARDLVYQIEAVRLLDRVALSAKRGEFVGLVGPNGAGKSTLLRTVSGLLRSNEGAVWLEGQNIAQLTAKEVARTVAQVPQIAPYTFGFTSLEVVLMGRYPHMGRFQVEGDTDQRIALDAMSRTETESFTGRSLTTLSGGERQRVFVARALAQQPRVLLLDEPTANLDIQHQLRVLDLVRGLVTHGMTAVAAIHDLSLAARYCHRLLLMGHGRVLAEGPPEEVLTPDNLEGAFGVRAVVYRDPLVGTPTLSVLEPCAPEGLPTNSGRIHVVCGGGSGARLLYELWRAGFTVTAGALGAGDTDRIAADILGIQYVPVAAFSPVDDDVHARHLTLVASADIAVLCDMPIGVNNVRNLEALSAARRLVCLESVPLSERDYTDGVASSLFASMRPIVRCRTPAETVDAIQTEMAGASAV